MTDLITTHPKSDFIDQYAAEYCMLCGAKTVSCSFNETGVTCPDTECEGHDHQTVTIRGIDYEVVISTTPDQFDKQGLHNLARTLREIKCSRQLVLKRKTGKTLYSTNEFVCSVGTVEQVFTYNKPFSLSF